MKVFKTEIKPTKKQKNKIHQSIGNCRFLYNLYLSKNMELYEQFKEGKLSKKDAFMSANTFDKWINNEFKKQEQYEWIDKCGSKARKKAICNAQTAYKRFFRGESSFPKFKKKKNQKVKLYFPKNNKGDWTVERHRIKIPTLGWVRLKEYGYIPTKGIIKVKNGTVSHKAEKYYVSLVVEIENREDYSKLTNEGAGIDLGLRDLVICSDGKVYKNINKTSKVKKLEKKLKREQRKLSRKYESLKIRNKKQKGGTATRQNIQKQIVKVQKLHQRLANIRTDYINKVISEIVKTKPSYITIEDLNVKGMMKNKHLSKAVAQQKFHEFKTKLIWKCYLNNIEVRIVDRWYPSSKLCSCCGNVKKDLKLKDRTYRCECELVIDRDLNASINLRNAKEYKIA